MSWAARRRFLILLILCAVIVAFIAVILIAALYKTPTCSDNVQNQNEAGVDCGGPCAFLCVADEQPPTVLFTKALTGVAGRTDVIASVENKNAAAAAKNVPYRIRLYGDGQILLQQISGTLDLPPGATMPVFIPGITLGKQSVVNEFLDIDPSSVKWFTLATDPRILPSVSNVTQGGSTDSPRIDAILTNSTVSPLMNVRVVVLVRDVSNEVIAASQTIVPSIGAQSTATAIFTWNSAFPSLPASIEVVPIIALP